MQKKKKIATISVSRVDIQCMHTLTKASFFSSTAGLHSGRSEAISGTRSFHAFMPGNPFKYMPRKHIGYSS